MVHRELRIHSVTSRGQALKKARKILHQSHGEVISSIDSVRREKRGFYGESGTHWYVYVQTHHERRRRKK